MPQAIFQLMQLTVWVVVTEISTMMLKTIVPSLIEKFYRKFPALLQSGSVQSDCFEEDTQNGQQQAATYEELINFGATVISTTLTVNTTQRIHMILYLPQFLQGLTIFIKIYFYDYSINGYSTFIRHTLKS